MLNEPSEGEAPERSRPSAARNLFFATLGISGAMVILLVYVDWAFPTLFVLAGLPYFWAIPSLYLGAPLCGLLALMRGPRRSIGWGLLLVNVIAVIVLAVLVNRSTAVDALMRV